MTSRTFDAAEWLATFATAGGGYAGTTLLFPKANPPHLRKMVRELTGEQIQALAQHMGVEVAE